MTRKDKTSKKQETSFFKVISTIGIFALVLLTIYFTFFLWHIFTPNDSQTFTYSKSDLGTLGDLIGGILNPVLSFVTIGLLLWSIRIQGRELNEATEQSKKSAVALQQTEKIHRDTLARAERDELYQNTKDKFVNLVNSFDSIMKEKLFRVVYPNQSGQSLHDDFSLELILKLQPQQIHSAFDYIEKTNTLSKLTRTLDRLHPVSKSILMHARTYYKHNVPDIYYSDDFLKCQRQFCGIYYNLDERAPDTSYTKASRIIDGYNELNSELTLQNFAKRADSQTQTKQD